MSKLTDQCDENINKITQCKQEISKRKSVLSNFIEIANASLVSEKQNETLVDLAKHVDAIQRRLDDESRTFRDRVEFYKKTLNVRKGNPSKLDIFKKTIKAFIKHPIKTVSALNALSKYNLENKISMEKRLAESAGVLTKIINDLDANQVALISLGFSDSKDFKQNKDFKQYKEFIERNAFKPENKEIKQEKSFKVKTNTPEIKKVEAKYSKGISKPTFKDELTQQCNSFKTELSENGREISKRINVINKQIDDARSSNGDEKHIANLVQVANQLDAIRRRSEKVNADIINGVNNYITVNHTKGNLNKFQIWAKRTIAFIKNPSKTLKVLGMRNKQLSDVKANLKNLLTDSKSVLNNIKKDLETNQEALKSLGLISVADNKSKEGKAKLHLAASTSLIGKSLQASVARVADPVIESQIKKDSENVRTFEAFVNNLERTIVYEKEQKILNHKPLDPLTTNRFKENLATLSTLVKNIKDQTLIKRANLLAKEIDELLNKSELKNNVVVNFHRKKKIDPPQSNTTPRLK